jgi:hypothetical protein
MSDEAERGEMTEKGDASSEKDGAGLWGFGKAFLKKPFAWIVGMLAVLMYIVGSIGGIPKVLLFDAATSTQAKQAAVVLGVLAFVIHLVTSFPNSHRAKQLGRWISLWCVLVAGLILCAFFDVLPWPKTDRLHEAADMIIVGLAVASGCGFIPAYLTASALEDLPDSIDRHIGSIKKREDDLINHIEDATRSLLPGFAKVFEKALWMIENAERELTVVNFAINFGDSHRCNKAVASEYEKQNAGRIFANDVENFLSQFRARVEAIPSIHILTVSDNGAREHFLRPLKTRNGYDSLDVDTALEALRAARDWTRRQIAERTNHRGANPAAVRIIETQSLPIQMLIAGLKPRPGSNELRSGCLLFMVGSETLQGIPTGDEAGFYTELEKMVAVFKNVATALIADAEKRPGDAHRANS